jgi:hypothetical protein
LTVMDTFFMFDCAHERIQALFVHSATSLTHCAYVCMCLWRIQLSNPWMWSSLKSDLSSKVLCSVLL